MPESSSQKYELLAQNRYLLSLKDLNLSARLEDLIDAGITSFKIEGRLKDLPYVVNRVEGPNITPQKMDHLRPGTKIYRNYDREFIRRLLQCLAYRNIQIALTLRETPGGVSLHAKDEGGVEAAFELTVEKQPAEKPDMALQTIRTQLSKLGDTPFECTDIRIETNEICFFPHSVLNKLKRGLVEALIRQRGQHRPRPTGGVRKNSFPYPEKHLTWQENVLNEKARNFYRRHGIETIEPAAEAGLEMHGKRVMTAKYCLREELGLCTRRSGNQPAGPLLLIDEEGREFLIHFRCGPCGMEIIFP